MGNTEKLAILIALLLSAVVLAVSLSDTGEEGSVEDPFGAGSAGDTVAAAERETSAPQRDPQAAEEASATPQAQVPLLDAAPEAELGLTNAERRAPVRGRLTSRQGLRPSFVDEYMEYTVEQGDTWSGLALRFYSDARMVSSLKIANDDLSELRVGTEILVPVQDLSAEAEQREPYRPATGDRARALEASAPRTQNTAAARPTHYTVVSGDNLSKISQKVFGKATRWAEIYAANRSLLESPDWLSVGMKLRIPKDGEFAGVKPPPTERDSAPSAEESEEANRVK